MKLIKIELIKVKLIQNLSSYKINIDVLKTKAGAKPLKDKKFLMMMKDTSDSSRFFDLKTTLYHVLPE